MDVTLLIATYNRAHLLPRLFSTLAEARAPRGLDCEIVVVDNNSTDETRQVVESAAHPTLPRPRYLFEPSQGKSYALNSGLQTAKGEFVAFLDDDVLVFPEYLEGLAHVIRAYPVNIFGGRVLPLWPCPPPHWITRGEPFRISRWGIAAHDYGEEPQPYAKPMRLPVGSNWVCRRSLFEKYGDFKTYLGRKGTLRYGGEETDLLRRFERQGEKMLYVPQLTVYHPVEPKCMTPAFHRKQHFWAGRTGMRRAFGQTSFRTFFGVPRYVYRDLLASLGGLIAASLRGRRYQAYDHQLELYLCLGAIMEAWQLSRRGLPQ